MPPRHDVYGIAGTTLDELVPRIQQRLGVELRERDSSYYGGRYYLYRASPGRELRLYENYAVVNGRRVREQHPEHELILELSDLDDMDELAARLLEGLPGAVRLRSTAG